MKRFLQVRIVFLTVLCLSSGAYAGETYISVKAGLGMVSDSDMTIEGLTAVVGFPMGLKLELEEGLAVGGAIGYDTGTIRLEGEVAFQENDFGKMTGSAGGVSASLGLSGNMAFLGVLLNGYYDFRNDGSFTPYVTAGLGFANISVNDLGIPSQGVPSSGDEDDSVFAYQVGGGLGFAISDSATLNIGYRLLGTADPEFEGVKAEFLSHNVLVGIRIKL